ncbi:hypothetical protein P4O66_020513, partial [Electrophorus voltai]
MPGRRALGPFLRLLVILRAAAFNLDEGTVLRKNGEAESLFGFSLAMHHQLRPTDQQSLLIGAPRAKALPIHKANITGGLYRCKFTMETDDCERIAVDTEVVNPGDGEDHRENQWLGVRVRSQGPGGKVVVCAHRYQYWVHSSQLVLGRCFILGEDLNVEDTRTFCLNRPSDKVLFGYCQQGLSVAFTNDSNYIVFGAPGAYDWKGTVRMAPVEDFTLEFYETGYQNVFRGESIPLGLSSYLGFALDSGMNLLRKGEQIIVAGAPRSNLSGEVVLLRPQAWRGVKTLSVPHILTGPGLASSFGYSLAVLDLNADGWDDLLVGAPQFTMVDMDSDVGGAVYVFINHMSGQDWDHMEPEVLYGHTGSMFGLAVASIGDVNQDHYNDFAVGAPYENDGAVYIYLGSAKHFSKHSYQVLYGKPHNIKLFGYSLAGNMDIDGNGYQDLAVGSLSDSVFLYRAKPVISIKKTLKLMPSEIDFQAKDCQKGHCIITAESCFSFTTYPETYDPKLQILYKLDADRNSLRYDPLPRVVFQTPAEDILMFRRQAQKQCVQTRLRLLGNIEDRLRNIPISVSVFLPSDTPAQTVSRRSLPALKPVLDALQPKETTSEFKFLNMGCGNDNVCQSNLQLQYRFCTKDQHQDKCSLLAREDGVAVITAGGENTALEITVTNQDGDDAYLTRLFMNFPESLPVSSIVLQQDSKVNVQCTVDGNQTEAACQLGNPFRRNMEVTLYLMLSSARLSLSLTDISVTLRLETISTQNISETVAEAKVIFEMDLQVLGLARPSQVYFGGTENAHMPVTSEEELGSPVEYEFRISNTGRPLRSFTSATLNIQWPKENSHGRELLYLVQITGVNKQAILCSPATEINPRKYTKVVSRGKRQAERESELEALSTDRIISVFGGRRKYELLTCGDRLKCVELKCPLEAVDSTAVVVLLTRLWNSTFLKVRLTVFPEKKPALLSRVPWWVALLSVVLALLLLTLLMYCLS